MDWKEKAEQNRLRRPNFQVNLVNLKVYRVVLDVSKPLPLEGPPVTYTSVPSPVEDYSDNGSPKGDGPPSPDYVPGPEEPEKAPLSPDYVPGSKEPEQVPLSPDYVPGPEEPKHAPPSHVYLPYVPELVYPEYMPPKDDVFPSEEVTKPLPHIPSPPLPIPLPPPDSPTHIEISESCLPLRKRLRFASPTPSQEVGESSAAGAARQNEPVVARDDPYSLVRENLYGFFDREAQDDRSQLRGRVNLLYRDRPVHRRLAIMIEREARMAREAWGLSMDASDNAHLDVMSLRTTLVAHHALILDLQAVYRKRQGVIKELLAADHKRQAQLTKALRSTPVITTPTPRTATLVTNAQLQAMIDQGVTAALAARDANRNGDDSHTSGMGRPVVMATKPKTMQDAIEFATELMNKKINTWAECQTDNKRKSDDTTRNNHQQPNKRQNTGRAYATGNGERKENQGHYRSDYPELKNQDHGNQARGTRAHRMVHALEGGETNQDLNDVENDINA
nr:hypothetical protein [Tanacetum cinerariifolium]